MQSKHMEVCKTGARSLMKGERADKKRSGILRSGRPAMWRKEARTQISVIQAGQCSSMDQHSLQALPSR